VKQIVEEVAELAPRHAAAPPVLLYRHHPVQTSEISGVVVEGGGGGGSGRRGGGGGGRCRGVARREVGREGWRIRVGAWRREGVGITRQPPKLVAPGKALLLKGINELLDDLLEGPSSDAAMVSAVRRAIAVLRAEFEPLGPRKPAGSLQSVVQLGSSGGSPAAAPSGKPPRRRQAARAPAGAALEPFALAEPGPLESLWNKVEKSWKVPAPSWMTGSASAPALTLAQKVHGAALEFRRPREIIEEVANTSA
jgi:hypothetical protein